MATAGKSMRYGMAALAMAACTLTAMPVGAQDSSDARLRKIEAEIRALQRQVFPGGDGRYFEPEINSGQTTQRPAVTPSSTAVTDILARLDALESQIAQLTSQTEENSNAIRQIQAQLGAGIPPSAAAPVTGTTTTTSGSTGLSASSGMTTNSGAVSSRPTPTPTAAPAPAATVAAPSPERLARVQAIAKPQSDDAGDDEYSYGFRLWDAGLFPEAQQQLKMFVDKYPNHWRTTYGRNLLGRAYLDDGKPRDAAPWFLQNYQSDKNGERAGDSLLYLAEAMIAMEDTRRACIALAEFGDTYPALAAGRLQSQYDANRRKVSCN